jgi:EmrB/QacA subfamily drug resistance transporter
VTRLTPVILSVALFMENMDSTVIATALATIAVDLGASPIALKLALTSYYVALAVFIPVSGRLADRLGPRRGFVWAIAVFMAGSWACAQAGSLGELVAARFLQGVGGSMMTPVGRLLLVRATPKAQLVSAMAWFSIPALVGPLAGPPIGGAIATYADWRWIFYVNIPIGLVGMVAAARYLPFVAPVATGPFDWRGFALSATACSGVVFGASIVSLPALPPALGVALIVLGVCAGRGYLRHARVAAAPLLRLSLMRTPTFRAAMTGGFVFRLGVGASPFLLPLLLQLGFGYSAVASGLITCVAIGGAMAMKLLAKPILRLLGFRATLALAAFFGGALIAPLGLWSPDQPLVALLAMLLAGGFLRSLFFTAANALAFSDLGPERMGDGTAMLAVNQQVSIAIGVALAGAMLEGMLVLRDAATLTAGDFAIAFLAVGTISAASTLAFLPLGPDAGAEVAGRPRRRAAAE